jgi:hypothetical protein
LTDTLRRRILIRMTDVFVTAVVVLATVAASGGAAGAHQGAGARFSASPTTPAARQASGDSSAFCRKLQPLVQAFVKPTIAHFSASDHTTATAQASDPDFLECDFRPPDAQIDVSLHGDADHQFDDPNELGHAPLAGFGDKARHSAQIAEMRWVDVVRGSIACEARFTIPDSQINGDWKQATGKICETAFSVR